MELACIFYVMCIKKLTQIYFMHFIKKVELSRKLHYHYWMLFLHPGRLRPWVQYCGGNRQPPHRDGPQHLHHQSHRGRSSRSRWTFEVSTISFTSYVKSFNERIRSSIFSLYVVFISRIIFFLLITYILIFIIRAVCTHTGGRYYTHDICIVFFNQISNIYFYNLFNWFPDIFIHNFLTLHLYLYVNHIIALIVLYVLYFSYICLVYFMYIYGRRLVWNKTLYIYIIYVGHRS